MDKHAITSNMGLYWDWPNLRTFSVEDEGMTKWFKTRYPGVRYKESPTRKHKGRPEKYFSIRYSREGRSIEEGCGWEGSGVTQQYAANLRSQITQNIRSAAGFQSLKEKREIEETRKKEESAARAEKRKRNIPFNTLAVKYIAWAKDNKKSWRDDESRYKTHVKPVIGNKPLYEISMIALERLKASLRKKGLADSTIKHCLVLVRQIYNRGIAWGDFQGKNPVSETSKRDRGFLKVADNRRTRFFSREEVPLLLKDLYERSLQTHDVALLSLYAGLRMGECFNLRCRDIDITHELMRIKDPKSGESRVAYIIPILKKMLQQRLKNRNKKDGYLFLTRKGKKVKEISNVFDRAVNRLKLNENVTDPRDRIVAHSLRHSFASWLIMDGVPLATVQKLMGHRSITMTLRYSHLAPSHEREAVHRLAENQRKVAPIIKKRRQDKSQV